jgi:hypothetical protein
MERVQSSRLRRAGEPCGDCTRTPHTRLQLQEEMIHTIHIVGLACGAQTPSSETDSLSASQRILRNKKVINHTH